MAQDEEGFQAPKMTNFFFLLAIFFLIAGIGNAFYHELKPIEFEGYCVLDEYNDYIILHPSSEIYPDEVRRWGWKVFRGRHLVDNSKENIPLIENIKTTFPVSENVKENDLLKIQIDDRWIDVGRLKLK